MAVEVTAKMVKELRELTGSGIMDCKKALIATDGDIQAAVEHLRKQGLALANKKAGRVAAEGLCAYKISDDAKKAIVVEVNSETDFVAKNDLFKGFVENVANQVMASSAETVDELKNEPWIENPNETVGEALVEKVAVIHENMQIRRFARVESDSYIGGYLHGAGRIAVLVSVSCDVVNDELKKVVKNLCMQVAGLNPSFLSKETVDAEWLAKETEIYKDQIKLDPKMASKPEQVIAKILEGKLNARFKEVCLMEQDYFLGEGSVKNYVEQAAKTVGAPITVNGYVRFETGEGIEKKQENFAEEVAKQMQ